jgi:sarcosine oxidase subunit gamma
MREVRPLLSRRMPLGETDAQQHSHAQGDAVAIRLLAPRARFSLRIELLLLARTKTVAGFTLDLPINRYAADAGRTAMRLGPDEWLLSGPESDAAQIAGDVEAALARLHHALVDVGHARVALSVSGPRAADVINSACALDLAPAAFPAGAATRTLLGKAEIILSKWDDVPTFQIECGRSFAVYVRDFLSDAARQYRASARGDPSAAEYGPPGTIRPRPISG